MTDVTLRNRDLDDLQAIARQRTRPQPVQINLDDDQHATASLDDLSRMSAEAVLTQYEAAARSVEEMGKAVKNMVKQLGAAMIECDVDMKHVAETAEAIREKGKHTEALIEQVGSLSKSIRAACDDFKKKVS